jgi:hypothetical protein
VVEGRFIFQTAGHGSTEAEHFIKLMRCLEAFSDLRRYAHRENFGVANLIEHPLELCESRAIWIPLHTSRS